MLKEMEGFHHRVARYIAREKLTYGGHRVDMDPSGRCPEDSRDMAHQGVHSAVVDHNFIACFLLARI